ADAAMLLQALSSDASSVLVDLGNVLSGSGAALDAQLLLHDVLTSATRTDAAASPPLVFCPRALEVDETLLHWHDEAVPAALADVLLFLQRNAAALARTGHGLYLHLAGLDAADEARFWSDIIRWLERADVVPHNAIKVSIGIDSVHANFVLHDIIDAARNDVTAIMTNRHSYLRSFIHTFQHLPQFVLPDRDELTPATHFLRTQGANLIKTAHLHGLHVIAACTASMPPESGEGSRTMQWLRSEIERDARDGFDGCSIADPGLVQIVKETFDRIMPGQHQLHRLRDDTHITAADLLQVAKGKITEDGLRANIRIALLGAAAGVDASAAQRLQGAEATSASIELAADQLWQWQWLDTGILDDGRIIDATLLNAAIQDEATRLNVAPEPLQAALGKLEKHLQQRDIVGHFLAHTR
ncbi:MAG: hypothetical protein WBM54_09255, partial [Woeseia sp.]